MDSRLKFRGTIQTIDIVGLLLVHEQHENIGNDGHKPDKEIFNLKIKSFKK
jgi:hypothetical protein